MHLVYVKAPDFPFARCQGRSDTITSMVRLIALAINMAAISIAIVLWADWTRLPRQNQCSFDANCRRVGVPESWSEMRLGWGLPRTQGSKSAASRG